MNEAVSIGGTLGAKVLVVDDDLHNCEIFSAFLHKGGFEPLCAHTAAEGLARAQGFAPDLIILDINLPDMSGFELCEQLKSHSALADIPVIFLTGLTDSKTMSRSFDVGGVDYIAKPVRRVELLARVSNHLAIWAYKRRLADLVDERTADLKRANATITSIIDSMPSVLIGVDRTLCITHWNMAAADQFGVSVDQAVGRPLGDLIDGRSHLSTLVERAISLGTVQRTEVVIPKADLENDYEELTVYPLIADHNGDDPKGAVVRIDNVSEKRRLEEMMVQSEKMMSIGGLAAGMAHEINNPLGGMLQNAQVIKNRFRSDLAANQSAALKAGVDLDALAVYLEERRVYVMLEMIIQSGIRASDIVRNMLDFARKGQHSTGENDLVALLESTLELIRNDYDLKRSYDFRKFDIVRNYDDDLPKVVCEPAKIQQVMLNVLKNGAQAMASRQESEGPDYTATFVLSVRKRATMVEIEISDNGPGIPKDVLKRIFEPFFTTKEVGTGTGLGLSVSYFIVVETHKGEMFARSEPGEGATITFRLPIV